MFYIYCNNSEALLKVHFLFLKYLRVLVITYTFYNWMVCSSFTLKGRETICRSFLFFCYVLLHNHFDWAGPLQIRLGWIFGHSVKWVWHFDIWTQWHRPRNHPGGSNVYFPDCWRLLLGCKHRVLDWKRTCSLVASRSKSCTFWSIFVTVVKAQLLL